MIASWIYYLCTHMTDLNLTNRQYDAAVAKARDIFVKKTVDYGTAWRILRSSSLTDQLYIKACRIRSIEEKGAKKVDEPIDLEYVGIINYSVMAIIQLASGADSNLEWSTEKVSEHYSSIIEDTKNLMLDKNHDYGEAWREMRISSMTDLILMKLLRIKSIESNDGKTIISEGLDANYQDIINYAVFALIKLDEK